MFVSRALRKFIMNTWSINYSEFLDQVAGEDIDIQIQYLSEELPFEWRRRYVDETPHLTNVCTYKFKSYEYLYDDYASLEATSVVPVSETIESRVVAVYGRSLPDKYFRD